MSRQKNQCCGTCRYWKHSGNVHGQCHAPLPVSLRIQGKLSGLLGTKAVLVKTSENDGGTCPAYMKRIERKGALPHIPQPGGME